MHNARSFIVHTYGFGVLIIIWMSMAAVNYPFAMWGELLCDSGRGLYYCATGATLEPSVLRLYLVLARIFNYILPIVVIWTAYIHIGWRLWRSPVKVRSWRFKVGDKQTVLYLVLRYKVPFATIDLRWHQRINFRCGNNMKV
jgi:hypothetical protein